MLPKATPSTRSVVRRGAGLALGVACAAALATAPAGGAPPPGKSTTFTGRIVSATGHDAALRGAVRIVLTAAPGSPPRPGPGSNPTPYPFVLAVSAPRCAAQAIRRPHRCAALAGRISGLALAALRHPDIGTAYALSGGGTVAPLGKVTVTGSSHSLGFIASGRFPLSLTLANGAGRVTITARGPLVHGFAAPF